MKHNIVYNYGRLQAVCETLVRIRDDLRKQLERTNDE